MMELIFEIIGSFSGIVGILYWMTDHDDIMHWLYFLMISLIMYVNAFRYGKGDDE